MSTKIFDCPEVRERVAKFNVKRYRELNEMVNHYVERHESYLAFEKRKKEPGFLYPNAYDTGGYEKDLENAKYWRDQFYEENMEYLL